MAAHDIDPVPAEAAGGAKGLDAIESVSAAPFEGLPAWVVGGSAPLSPLPPRKRRISRRAKLASLAGVVVAVLIAGLVVWSPWMPNPPTEVRATSPTASSVVVSWVASNGSIVSPGNYLVLRNGRQVGSVSAGTTSWTDHGLAPGATYHYTVVAAGLAHSAPSATATVTTITPSPIRLTAHPTHTTVDLHWSPSPLGPTPEHYVLSNGTTVVATLPGTTTSYTEQSQSPGTSFNYTVVAEWGSYLSGPSAAVSGATIAAPLNSEVPVHVNTTSSPGSSWGPLVDGYHWDDTWSAAPACNPSNCPAMTMMMSIGPAGTYQNASFSMTLHSSGTGYNGTATEKVTGCTTSTGVISYSNTITLTLTPTKVQNGAWTGWTGTMTMIAPYMAEGTGYYCPSASWAFAVTSGLSRSRLSGRGRAEERQAAGFPHARGTLRDLGRPQALTNWSFLPDTNATAAGPGDQDGEVPLPH